MGRKAAKKTLRKSDLKKTKGGTTNAPRDTVSGNSTGRRGYKFFF